MQAGLPADILGGGGGDPAGGGGGAGEATHEDHHQHVHTQHGCGRCSNVSG